MVKCHSHNQVAFFFEQLETDVIHYTIGAVVVRSGGPSGRTDVVAVDGHERHGDV
jgi:hypothetical protein